MIRLLLLLGLLLLLPTPSQAQQTPYTLYDITIFTPPPFFAHIYAYLARCAEHRPPPFSEITWVKARHIESEGAYRILGLWSEEGLATEGGDTIPGPIIAIRADRSTDLSVIGHEMLHNIFRGEFPSDISTRCLIW